MVSVDTYLDICMVSLRSAHMSAVQSILAGTSPRGAVDRSFSGSTEHTVQHSSGCNGVAHGPPGLPGRLSGPEPGCSSLDRDSLPSTASEAPSGSSDDRRLNGGTHLV